MFFFFIREVFEFIEPPPRQRQCINPVVIL
jgi:hypothetical protein